LYEEWPADAPSLIWAWKEYGNGQVKAWLEQRLTDSVPVTVSFQDGSSIDVDLVAGFFAVQQNTSDLNLSPLIGWCVTEPPPKTPVMI
jgi:hypothetical protein